MTKEKRKQPRLEANLFAELSGRPSGDPLGRGVVVDVSLSGLAIETEADFSVDDMVTCHIEVPLKLEARIVRRISNGQVKKYGLRFENQSIFDRFMFKKILKGKRQTRRIE